MKKIWLPLSFLILAFSLSSCRGDRGPIGPRGPQGPAGPGLSFQIIDFSINASDWDPFNNPNDPDFQFYAEFQAPEIDAFTYDNAVIIGYQEDQGTTYTLPNTVNFGDYIREFSFYYGVGYVGFVVKDSDLQTTAPDVTTFFKIYILRAAGGKKAWENLSEEELNEALERAQATHHP